MASVRIFQYNGYVYPVNFQHKRDLLSLPFVTFSVSISKEYVSSRKLQFLSDSLLRSCSTYVVGDDRLHRPP